MSAGVEVPQRSYDNAVESKKELRSCYDSRMADKECPMCGEFMRHVVRESIEHAPGLPQPIARTTREWVCPDCDYFEEADD
jgi:hypothetical protein